MRRHQLRISRRCESGADAGSASPLVVAIIAVVVSFSAALAQVGAGLIAETQAQGAADLAALAAARIDRDERAQSHTPASALRRACETAAHVARRNGASVTACVRGADVSVVVAVTVPRGGWPSSATASARAGVAS